MTAEDVKRGGTRRFELLVRQQVAKLLTFRSPLFVVFREHVGQTTPAHVTHQDSPLVGGRNTPDGFNVPQTLDGAQVAVAFAPERSVSDLVLVSNPMVALIAKR